MRFFSYLITIALLFTFAILATPSYAQSPPLTDGPVFDPFVSSQTVLICDGGTVFDTIIVTDADPVQTITITKVSGPGSFNSSPSASPATGYFEYTPAGAETFDVVYRAESTDGDYAEVTKTYVVMANVPPEILSGNQTFYKCWIGTTVLFPLEFYDPDSDSVTISDLNDVGWYDYSRNAFAFYAKYEGEYCFNIEVADECGADTTEICLTIIDNEKPTVNGFTEKYYICEGEEVCFSVSAIDPENDSLLLEQVEGPGVFTRIDNNNGTTCFYPPAADSAEYIFVYRVADSCRGAFDDYKAAWPPGPQDTVIITIVQNRGLFLSCPNDTSVALCEPETICIPIGDVPSDAIITLTPETVKFNEALNAVCFDAYESGSVSVKFIAENNCGKDSCEFNVDVSMNSLPVVAFGGDYSVSLCEPEEICVPVTFTDTDNDATITEILPEGAYYNEAAGEICFTPDGSGDYTILVTAIDECNTPVSDDIIISVDMGHAPIVISSPDSTVFLCDSAEICFPVSVTDLDDDIANIQVIGPGEYSNGHVCFSAGESGEYEFIVKATDICGATDEDTTYITVNLNQGPSLTAPEDFTVYQCRFEEICFDVDFSDPDNNIQSVTSSNGVYNSETGTVCFTPDAEGQYTFDLVVIDSCYDTSSATVKVDVILEETALIDCPQEPIYEYLCGAGTICYDLAISPSNAIINVTGATYENGQICFDVTESGTYTVNVSAESDCGTVNCDLEFIVDVGTGFTLTCPEDDYPFLCEPDTICYPIGNIPSSATVTVFPPSAWYDEATQSVCYYTNCTVKKELMVIVEGECNTDTCEFVSYALMNREPLVISAPDTTVNLCLPEEICIPVGVIDFDSNGDTVVVSEGVDFNRIAGRACFTPDTSGVYNIIIRAIDDCGLYDDDTTVVTVNLNAPPVVVAGDDFSIFLCDFEEICFPVNISDDFSAISNVTVSSGGYYNEQTESVCFTPTEEGEHVITITAYDDCGEMGSDVITITVDRNAPPTVVSAPDYSLLLCELQEVCFDVDIDDINGNIANIEVSNGGVYNNGTVCFTPKSEGTFWIITTVTDECGAITEDTTKVTINLNSSPIVQSADDFEVFQCDFEEICFAISATDINDNIVSVVSNVGAYNSETGLVCFTPDSAGVYVITITAEDACGERGTATTTVTVTTGPAASITCPPEPIEFFICEPQDICFPLEITPVDAEVSVIGGTYANGQVCLNVTQETTYNVRVIADAVCGSDTCDIEVIVDVGDPAQLTCPDDTTFFFCEPSRVCRPVGVIPAEAIVTVSPIGTYADGFVCFDVSEAGRYDITVTAEMECGTDECTFGVDVEFNSPPEVSAGEDDSFFQCVFEEICHPVNVTDIDNNIDQVMVSPVGYYDDQTGNICFTPDAVGEFCLEVKAIDECGLIAFDSVCFTITTGDTAQIVCPGGPFERYLCEPGEVCIPFEFSPENATITVSQGTYANGQICFTAEAEGQYNIQAIAAGSCASDTCDIIVNVVFDDYADIVCPTTPIAAELCEPGNVFLPLIINPPDAEITITPDADYDAQNHILSFRAETGGTFDFRVIALAPCSADTCDIQVNVDMSTVPQLTCPGGIDTLVCLENTETICFPVDYSGSGVIIEVLPEGSFSGNEVCVPVSAAGEFDYKIVADNNCGADTCDVTITIADNSAPELTVPTEEILIPWCEGDDGTICVDGIFATDPDGDDLTFTQTCGLGSLEMITADSGRICFDPIAFDTTYSFCVNVDDGCNEVEKSFDVTLFQPAECEVCLVASIESDSCYYVGSQVPVRIKATTSTEIAGFDILLKYDNSVMFFINARLGDENPDWEYFTYRIFDDGSGCSNCSGGILRLFSYADIDNGPHHPPEEQYMPDGDIAVINMQIFNDFNLGGLFLPISFFWQDCGDNGFSDPLGNELYVDLRIYNSAGNLQWDESDDSRYPEDERIQGLGVPDSCTYGDKIFPIRCVEFYDGGICVKHPDEIDDRGDLNLNGIAYEIADAVVFTNYFVYGLSAFVNSVPGQTAASDVNADGRALTVADLVYLIRVIIGDSQPIPKPIVGGNTVAVSARPDNYGLAVNVDTDYELGAGLFVFEYDGVVPDMPELRNVNPGMNLAYDINESEIRVLLYSMEPGVRIETGRSELIKIPYDGNGSIRLKEVELATYLGQSIESNLSAPAVPIEFEVSQNYPNPFNPTTQINLSLPASGHWNLTVFNIAGQVVRTFSGESGAGPVTVTWDGDNDNGQPVASGVYFYRAEFGEQNQTKKMIMLK